MALSKNNIEDIIKAYEASGGIIKKAVLLTGFSSQSIIKYWKEAGLAPKKYSDLIQDELDKYKQAYRNTKGDTKKAANELCCSEYTVRKYWKLLGFKSGKAGQRPDGKYGNALTDEQVNTIKSEFKAGKSIDRIASLVGCCPTTVIRYLEKSGVPKEMLKYPKNYKHDYMPNKARVMYLSGSNGKRKGLSEPYF